MISSFADRCYLSFPLIFMDNCILGLPDTFPNEI